MAKGYFTQGAVVLLRESLTIEALGDLLADYEVVKQVEPMEHWEFGGPALVLAYRPEVNGYLSVDTVNLSWPDAMGDPASDPFLFAGWSMGHFGPYAFPYGLRRACQQCWGWEAAESAVAEHKAFVRLLLSYGFGADDEAPIMPSDCDPGHELDFVTGVVQAVLRHPAGIAYYNPNGEVLQTADMLAEALHYHAEHELPPLPAWSNIRIFDVGDGWSVMDTIGNWQLDIPDQEAGFPRQRCSPDDVDNFLRNATLYMLRNGMVIKDGDTMGGAGGMSWRAAFQENALCEPPRQVLRWLPKGQKGIPEALLAAEQGKPPRKTSSKPWWKIW